MEASESLDLDSFIDLIEKNVIEDESNIISKVQTADCESSSESNDADLNSLVGLITEDDSICDISIGDQIANDEKAKILNVDVDFLSPAAVKILDVTDTTDAPQNNKVSLIHMGDSSEEEGEKEYLTETGQQIKQKIKLKPNYENNEKERITWKSKTSSNCVLKEDAHSLDHLTGIRIINPLVSFDVMKKRLQGRKLIKMSFMKNLIKKGDIEGDWVIVGVVARKVPPKTSKTGKLFSIWKLTDLHDTDKITSLFLFGGIHNEHWKTAVGTVVGLLNPTIMEARDRDDYASIKIDHPGKMMLIGTSKDFGHCKSVKKDGTQCTMVVNLSQCQYCAYHVKNEYKKFSQRSDIQTSWSGRELSLRSKVLKGQKIFYAGQTFVPLGKQEKKSNSVTSKDKLTLSNLSLKRKAATVFNEEKSKSIKRIAEMYGDEASKAAGKNSEFINNQLMIPSAGSRNFLQHMIKNKTAKEENVSMINPKELLKEHALHLKSRIMPSSNRKDDSAILQNLVPILGKGLCPGQNVTLDISAPNANSLAKIRAIQKIKQSGPLRKKNPNATKSNPEPKKIKAALNSSFEEKSADDKMCEQKGTLSRSKLGCIDLNSEKVQKYLNQKSNHAYEVEMAEMEREAAYFKRMEKKEMMEEKMSSTKEIVCDVVSCKQCRYTAHQAADRCKNEKHPLKCHKAIKRFFACKDCNQRTECFSRFPLRSCSSCGGSRFERTGMIRVRSGPKLDFEILNIDCNDVKFLNSL